MRLNGFEDEGGDEMGGYNDDAGEWSGESTVELAWPMRAGVVERGGGEMGTGKKRFLGEVLGARLETE